MPTLRDRLVRSRLSATRIATLGYLTLAVRAGNLVDLQWLAVGLAAIVFGTMLRMSAVLYRGRHAQDMLLTSGPYGCIRHPRYVGTILVFAGLTFSVGPGPVGLMLLTVVSVVHVATAHQETAQLSLRLGTVFDEYQRNVPAWIPRDWRRCGSLDDKKSYGVTLPRSFIIRQLASCAMTLVAVAGRLVWFVVGHK